MKKEQNDSILHASGMSVMKSKFKHLIFDIGIYCFFFAGRLMHQRPKLKGRENLKDVPLPIIFTVTHDSYFEIPSLAKVYQALKPRPVFAVMAKKDFLSGNYLSSNFRVKNSLLKSIFRLLDKSGIPKTFFKILNLSTVHRPFIESAVKTKDNMKKEISGQLTHFKEILAQGMSTLVFPEGTTWGFGGLKKIRSSAHQLVSSTFSQYRKKVYVLPINVKADWLVQGCKDVFINVGKPQFIIKSKEEFNQQLRDSLQRLHTITFSQIGAYYLKKASSIGLRTRKEIVLSREIVAGQIEKIVRDIYSKVQGKILPACDVSLIDKKYLMKKINGFVKYCTRNNYLIETSRGKGIKMYILNREKVLAQYPAKTFRKLNPVGFHANELVSLGEKEIEPLFNISGFLDTQEISELGQGNHPN
ncbi:MAG: 1-acyl-sn-glycerol-3-phosphate acyltransferase [Deltaproteobacteria bacterium]|nr:1-acyl-sn-glycerol-3-phosphate acyltransferase [Deltaproteobacteria bacterium]MBW2595673.1 1-acyl-sn-glycerol-3-phosphate acyltransferase [Deltaproteobacteria bacterium]MBW2650031.1 1-acyl-sn-glycerol-3-phosphate acyltransferase [Deltaproteobacteria bacterium]